MSRGLKQQSFSVWAYALLIMSMFFGAMNAQAGLTAAGTVIKNLATVSYEDTLGNQFTAQSNESVVTVAEVYAPDLQRSQTKNGAKGQIVYFPHQLINNGNAKQTFSNLKVVANDGTHQDNVQLFRDLNGNGMPDGESISGDELTSVTVDAGAIANFVVAVNIPGDQNQKTYKVKLSVQPLPTEGHPQNMSLENTDIVNVVDDRPVLVITKQALNHTPAHAQFDSSGNITEIKGSIQYRVTVTNNGIDLTEAMNGRIYDPLSDLLDVNDIESITIDSYNDQIEVQKGFESKANLEDIITDNQKPGYEYAKVLDAKIKNLESGTTASLTFTVEYQTDSDDYKFNAGDVLKNRAYATFKLENDPKHTTVASNDESTVLPQFYGVELFGHDKPDTSKTSTVTNANAGGIAEFHAFVKNKGNGYDQYTLALDENTSTFPSGTTFTFLDKTGSIELQKQGSSPVTALTPKGAEVEIVVKAHLPAGEKGTESKVKLIATSVGDARIRDAIDLIITSIKAPNHTVEGELAAWVGEPATATFAKGVNPVDVAGLFGKEKVHTQTPVVEETYTDASGQRHVKFGLYIANKSEHKAASFSIQSILTGPEKNDVSALWPITYVNQGVFKKSDSATNLDIQNLGQKLPNRTPSLVSDTYMKVIADVTVPTALSDRLAGEYTLVFTLNNGLDTLEANIIVAETGAVMLTPNGSNQVEAGGSVYYEHELRNLSNKNVTVTDLKGNDLPSDWSYLMFELKDGSMVKDGVITLSSINLAAGETKRFKVKVMSPANAIPGSIAVLRLRGGYTLQGSDLTVEASDSTTVMKGQVRLVKSVAIGNSDVFKTSIESVKPGETVTWKIVATNQGDSSAKNVVIEDIAPQFTTLVQNTAKAVDGKAIANEAAPKVTFYVGEDAEDGKGGTLNPGESVTVIFQVKLDGDTP